MPKRDRVIKGVGLRLTGLMLGLMGVSGWTGWPRRLSWQVWGTRQKGMGQWSLVHPLSIWPCVSYLETWN